MSGAVLRTRPQPPVVRSTRSSTSAGVSPGAARHRTASRYSSVSRDAGGGLGSGRSIGGAGHGRDARERSGRPILAHQKIQEPVSTQADEPRRRLGLRGRPRVQGNQVDPSAGAVEYRKQLSSAGTPGPRTGPGVEEGLLLEAEHRQHPPAVGEPSRQELRPATPASQDQPERGPPRRRVRRGLENLHRFVHALRSFPRLAVLPVATQETSSRPASPAGRSHSGAGSRLVRVSVGFLDLISL